MEIAGRILPLWLVRIENQPHTEHTAVPITYLYWPAMCFLGQWSRLHVMLMVLLFIPQTFIQEVTRKEFMVQSSQEGVGRTDFKKYMRFPGGASGEEPPMQET